MNREIYIEKIIHLLGLLENRIVKRGHLNLRDINFHCENFYRDFLNLIYDLNLINLNSINNNQDTIDLGDKIARKSFQVTSSVTRTKVNDTINGFEKHLSEYDELFMLFIVPKDKLKDSKGEIKSFESLFNFDTKKHLLDNNDLLKKIQDFDIKKIRKVYNFIIKELQPQATSTSKVTEDKYPIFNDDRQKLDNLWNIIDNKFEISAEQIAINLRGIVWYSKHSKKDFARLAGIGFKEFDQLLKGEKIPKIEDLIRICKQVNLDINFFFEPNYLGNKPFWKSELAKFSIIKLIVPAQDINKIKDIDKFMGSVTYKTASNLIDFNDWLDDTCLGGWGRYKFEKILQEVDKVDKEKVVKLKGELSHQHYKLREQVQSLKTRNSVFTKVEILVSGWLCGDSNYMARIFTEAIRQIKVGIDDEPEIDFHFWKEVEEKNVRYREYDKKEIKIIFFDEPSEDLPINSFTETSF